MIIVKKIIKWKIKKAINAVKKNAAMIVSNKIIIIIKLI